MYRFVSLDQVEIKNRGTSYIVECPKDTLRDDLMRVIGKTASINGKVYEIKGIESYAIPFIRKGTKIGLLV